MNWRTIATIVASAPTPKFLGSSRESLRGKLPQSWTTAKYPEKNKKESKQGEIQEK